MKALAILVLTLLVTGCSSGKIMSSVVQDILSAAPAACSAANAVDVQAAKDEIFKQIPDGTDKTNAQRAVDDAMRYGIPAVCNVLKAIEAQQAAQAKTAPIK